MADVDETADRSDTVSPLVEKPPSVEIVPAMAEQQEPASIEPVKGESVSEESGKQEPENKGLGFLFGLLLPLVVLLFLTNSSLLSAGAWEFNRRVEVTLFSDDDGVFQFDAGPKSSHGVEESVNFIFLDPAYSGSAMAYRPEIHIGPNMYTSADYRAGCDVQSLNNVCMYSYKAVDGGEVEWTKLGEYDQLNHTAEFVLNGEANESIGVRIDYYDHGAEDHFYEVEQPRNMTIVTILLVVAFISILGHSALKKDASLLAGMGTSVVVIIGFVVLAVVAFVFQILGDI